MSGARTQSGLHHFAGALQRAMTRDEVSAAYLESARLIIPADGIGLYELDPDSGAVCDVAATVRGDFLGAYEEFGRADDPVLAFVAQHNRAIDSSRVVETQVWEACGARSALGLAGYAHSMEAPVHVSGLMFGTINFARTPEHPIFSTDDLANARLASEQLGLALERAMRFETLGTRSSVLEHALDRLPQAILVTDRDHRVVYRNRAARNTWSDSVLQTAQLNPHDPVGIAVAELLDGLRTDNRRALSKSVSDARMQTKAIVKSLTLSEKEGTAITLVYAVERPEAGSRLPVWDALSKREQQIAQLVSEGLTTKQIAQTAFISENTVKQHLKRVFAKTEVRNRAELVQLIWTSGHSPEEPPELLDGIS